jgi:hypothetical protein
MKKVQGRGVFPTVWVETFLGQSYRIAPTTDRSAWQIDIHALTGWESLDNERYGSPEAALTAWEARK